MTNPEQRPESLQPVIRNLAVHFAPAAASRVGPRVQAADLPVSCRRILEALQEGPSSHGGLRASTGLPARTLRYALGRLRREDRVIRVPSIRDARLVFYAIHPGHMSPERRRALGRSMTRLVRSGTPDAQ